MSKYEKKDPVEGKCPCGETWFSTQPDKLYCSKKCKSKYGVRRLRSRNTKKP